MFPGFVSSYRDKDDNIHIYFFPGISDEGNEIYCRLDLSDCNIEYTEEKNIDNSIDFRILDSDIKKIYCKLIYKNDNNKSNFIILNI